MSDTCPRTGEGCVPSGFESRTGAPAAKREQDRLNTLYVTLPNYVRIVYGYVPEWANEAMRRG